MRQIRRLTGVFIRLLAGPVKEECRSGRVMRLK